MLKQNQFEAIMNYKRDTMCSKAVKLQKAWARKNKVLKADENGSKRVKVKL